jgi:post-segregation antitoxin (ccd killing protein)
LKERIYTEARAEARNKGIPVSDLIEIAIERFLKKSA